MKTPQKAAPRLQQKTDQELIAVLASPAASTPADQAAAKAEIWRRMQVSDARQAGASPRGAVPPKLSSLAVYSLVLCLLPYFGLPLAIGAVRRIAQSEGRLYGRKLAWASVVVNAVCLGLLLAIFLTTILASLARR